MSLVNVSGARIRSGVAIVSFLLSSSSFAAISRKMAFCCCWVSAWNLLYGSMFGWMMRVSRDSGASIVSLYFLPIRADTMNGTIRIAIQPVAAAAFAFMLKFHQLPSDSEVIRPKIPRLQAHTQSEPPRAPVISYHWTAHNVLANEFPRTSQGHDISASK